MKSKFYIQYWDKYGNVKHLIIKARDKYHAEDIFYKRYPYTLIRKISLV